MSGVFYLLTGIGHSVRLVTSIWSLRKFYNGPITVFSTQEGSERIGSLCALDRRLDITHKFVQEVGGRNSAFLTKLELLKKVSYDPCTYLDADTIVAGSIDDLLSCEAEFCATQFGTWTSKGGRIRGRIKGWRDICPDLLPDALAPRPAVNGGIFSFRKDAAILEYWRELSFLGRKKFICDEVALQLLLHHFPHKVLDCRFNCSPVYAKDTTDVRIWHFHGDKHVREYTKHLWLPTFEECLKQNVANILEWMPYGDRHLKRYLNL